ncbi:hypothetical protein PWT90_09794 [Aphanocladium album]|nr:hypothetical protein PWT90_09794 [Aphanocladium album]
MDAYGVRRKDTTKGPPLRILSLDGGGVRGYSMLIIVQELMHRTFVEAQGRAPRRHEIPKPCDHFDLIVGTGTGGLIAIMLGRLRLDLETCKELYVRMTRMVFQTDKTIAGIPYRSTLFKASKLEDAIRQAVREHTVNDQEGNDGEGDEPVNPLHSSRLSTASSSSVPQRHLSNASTISFSARSPTAQAAARPFFSSRLGNGEARLYDSRENRTKTAVTAMYKDSPRHAAPVILRSYDSRREPPPDFDCKIWQAGRATCAIGLAFKPISIGQSSFHDDGAGTFNPAPEALDEAVVNEWPGRDVGVFVSVGTGKRPRGSDSNQQVWYEGFLGEFAEARRRLISKIEGCEKIHEFMLREHLSRRNVNPENYFRLNVEIGVGEFGMNEWNRLGDISTGTRRYMARDEEQRMIQGISSRLAKVHRARQRLERQANSIPEVVKQQPSTNFEVPFAVELPGDVPSAFPPSPRSALSRTSFDSGRPDSLTIGENQATWPSSPRSSYDYSRPGGAAPYPPSSAPPPPPSRGSYRNGGTPSNDPDRLLGTAPTPSQYRLASGAEKIAIMSPDEHARPPPPAPQSAPPSTRIEPPPLPPKTPLPGHRVSSHASNGHSAPYPMDEEEAPPPPVNMARKPEYRG